MAKPSVLIKLDRPRQLRMDTNALVLVEDLLDRPVTKLDTNMGFRELRVILWAGLRHEDKNLSLEDAGDLIDEGGFTYVSDKITEAMTLSFGNKNKEQEAVVATDPNV